MKKIFRLKYKSKSKIISGFALAFLLLISCERIEKEDLQSQLVSENTSISKQEIQRILNTKVNLQSFQVTDEVKISLPDNYYFQTEFVEKDDYDVDFTFGKLDFSAKENYSNVELNNSLFVNYSLYDESVYVVKEKNSNLLTIEDIKENIEIENIYYEDEKSIVFNADDTFTTLYFQYDAKSESYLIYKGSIAWDKKFPLDEKLDLTFYFLRNAKNLLSTNFSKQEFMWKDYVENRPKIEINLMKNQFANFDKEMKVFLDENQSVKPKYEDYSFFELYRFNSKKEVEFYEYMNNLAGYDSYDGNKWLREIFHEITNYGSDSKYTITNKGNVSIVEVRKVNDEGKEFANQYAVFCVLSYKNKMFVLKNTNELYEKDIDLFVKMFNYFSNNGTLEITAKK